MTGTGEKKRLNLDMGPLHWQRLEELSTWSGTSNAETVRRALRLHHHIAAQVREGGKLFIRNEDGTEAAIVMFVNEDE